jgi:hypothetical protein
MTPEQIDNIIQAHPDWEFVKKDAPHDDMCWVKINAIIRNNLTDEVRIFGTDGIWDVEYNAPNLWIWGEGNFSCGCNRQLFFQRASGEDETEEDSCSSGRFSVNLQNPKTGEMLYREFDNEGED